MAKKIIGGLFGGKKKAKAVVEETGPKVTALSADPALDLKKRLPAWRSPMAPDATILSDKLGS